MHKFDTIQGKLFYTRLTLNKKGYQKNYRLDHLKISINEQNKNDNTLITRRSLLDLADVDEDQKDEQKIEKNRPITIRPIQTNSKYKSNQSLLSSPQRK